MRTEFVPTPRAVHLRAAAIRRRNGDLVGAIREMDLAERVGNGETQQNPLVRDAEGTPVASLSKIAKRRCRLAERLVTILEEAGYSTIESLLDATPRELLKVPQIGRQSLVQIYEALAAKNWGR